MRAALLFTVQETVQALRIRAARLIVFESLVSYLHRWFEKVA